MTNDESPATLANTAAEAVRALNHATLAPTAGYREPSDVDAVIAHLETLVERLPQALQQAQLWLDARQGAGDLVDATGREHAEVVVAALGTHLEYASSDLERLRQSLHHAHQLTARLAVTSRQ